LLRKKPIRAIISEFVEVKQNIILNAAGISPAWLMKKNCRLISLIFKNRINLSSRAAAVTAGAVYTSQK